MASHQDSWQQPETAAVSLRRELLRGLVLCRSEEPVAFGLARFTVGFVYKASSRSFKSEGSASVLLVCNMLTFEDDASRDERGGKSCGGKSPAW